MQILAERRGRARQINRAAAGRGGAKDVHVPVRLLSCIHYVARGGRPVRAEEGPSGCIPNDQLQTCSVGLDRRYAALRKSDFVASRGPLRHVRRSNEDPCVHIEQIGDP